MDLDLRPARATDAEEVSHVIVSALRETNAGDHLPADLARLIKAFSPDSVRVFMSRRKAFIATSDGCVVGTAGMGGAWEGAWVRTVFVAPDFQGRGIGARLMAEVAAARSEGTAVLRVPSSVTAEGIHARLGFRPVVRESFHGDERSNVMERVL